LGQKSKIKGRPPQKGVNKKTRGRGEKKKGKKKGKKKAKRTHSREKVNTFLGGVRKERFRTGRTNRKWTGRSRGGKTKRELKTFTGKTVKPRRKTQNKNMLENLHKVRKTTFHGRGATGPNHTGKESEEQKEKEGWFKELGFKKTQKGGTSPEKKTGSITET